MPQSNTVLCERRCAASTVCICLVGIGNQSAVVSVIQDAVVVVIIVTLVPEPVLVCV